MWHAPAEGGIPRYMAIYQSRLGTDIGPVRSARVYYVLWASELNAVYGHSGGSPQALRMLSRYGQGEYVFDANEFRYGGGAFGRVDCPTGAAQRLHRRAVGCIAWASGWARVDRDVEPFWAFGPDLPLAERPEGGTIKVPYPHNTVTYRYDRESNTYPRAVSGEKRQIDAADDEQRRARRTSCHARQVHPDRRQQEPPGGRHRRHGQGRDLRPTAGSSRARWKKAGDTDPTRFFDANGEPVVFTTGPDVHPGRPDRPRGHDDRGGTPPS